MDLPEDAGGPLGLPTWSFAEISGVPHEPDSSSSTAGSHSEAEGNGAGPSSSTGGIHSEAEGNGAGHIPGDFIPEEVEEPAGGEGDGENGPPQERHYGPRKCRICLEIIHPTFTPPAQGIAGLLNPRPAVQYISENPRNGRLFRPCRCKGSIKWTHEGCLSEWRNTVPDSPNYVRCNICSFKYEIRRLSWGQFITSKLAHMFLTAVVFLVLIFVLGFIAEPIINFYLDPYDVMISGGLTDPVLEFEGVNKWFVHLFKGAASLGVLGILKVFLAFTPWQWLYLRNTGIMGRRARGANGRDRMANMSWWFVAFGVATFVYAVYKLISVWTMRVLEKAGQRVVDVQGEDNGDDDDE